MSMESKYIWMNGEMVPFEKATLHFLTPALHYGAGVFEGIRAYNTAQRPCRLSLEGTCRALVRFGARAGFQGTPLVGGRCQHGHQANREGQ